MAVGVGAGVIAAIIIVVIVAAVAFGAGAVGVYKYMKVDTSPLRDVADNPLYDAPMNDMENPLYGEGV